MAFVINDRVKETSTDTGTGTFDLGGAADGFETFVAGIGNSNITYYAIVHATEDEWEVGYGTVTDASTDTLSRTAITSSNSDSLVNFSSGTKSVFCTMPASKVAYQDKDGNFIIGTDAAGTDYNLTFRGEDNDGVLTWMEDEDYFKFGDDVLINSTEKLMFQDTGTYIYSNADGDIDVVSDGTAVDSINLESAGGITLDAGTASSGVIYEDDGTEMLRIHNSSSDVILEAKVQDKDILFKGDDGGSGITALTLDMSAAGAATFNDKIVATELDISSDIDIDGVANLDNTDIDGTLTVDGTAIDLNATSTLAIDNTNTSNGITIGTSTSGVPISIGHSTSEVTINDNLTVTGTLTLGSGAELAEAELEMLDGITAGTVAASKAVVVDANKDAASFRNVTLTGELDAATLDLSGDADIAGTTNLDNTDIDGTLTVDGTAIDFNATSTLAIDNTNTSNGIVIGTSTSGVPISIGHSTSEVTVNDNLTVTGNFTVSGTSTTIDSTTVAVADAMFKLAKDQGTSADALDFGIYGQYGVGGTAKYAGIFRDVSATGDPFTFFDTLEAEPGTTVNTSGTGYDLADIAVGGATFADDIDVDGTTNLDAVDIDGATQIDATVTVGENDTGYDVKFFGATSGAYMLWDESEDDLVLAGAAGIDLAGDIDVDGTANLDAVDIDGAVQIDNTITVGANDQGYDIIFYGDTASANMTWDTSADDLILNGAARIVVPDSGLVLGSTAVAATAAELNIMDGGTAASSTTLADGDRVVVNDDGTMKQVAMTDISTYTDSGATALAIALG